MHLNISDYDLLFLFFHIRLLELQILH